METTKSDLGGESVDRTAAVARDVSEEIETDDDSVESQRFWVQADRAAAWRRSLFEVDRRALLAREAEIDSAFAGLA